MIFQPRVPHSVWHLTLFCYYHCPHSHLEADGLSLVTHRARSWRARRVMRSFWTKGLCSLFWLGKWSSPWVWTSEQKCSRIRCPLFQSTSCQLLCLKLWWAASNARRHVVKASNILKSDTVYKGSSCFWYLFGAFTALHGASHVTWRPRLPRTPMGGVCAKVDIDSLEVTDPDAWSFFFVDCRVDWFIDYLLYKIDNIMLLMVFFSLFWLSKSLRSRPMHPFAARCWTTSCHLHSRNLHVSMESSPCRLLRLLSDSYKTSHWRQYPPNTTEVYSCLAEQEFRAFASTGPQPHKDIVALYTLQHLRDVLAVGHC